MPKDNDVAIAVMATLTAIVMFIAIVLLINLIPWACWNYVIVSIYPGLPLVTYWQMLLISVAIRVLFFVGK